MKTSASTSTSAPTAPARSPACWRAKAASTKHGGRDLDAWEALDEIIPRAEIPKNLHYVCMTQYDKLYSLPLVIPPRVDG